MLSTRSKTISPNTGTDRLRKLHHFPISKTPFVVVYEYDETELRVLFIVHKRADRRRLDPSAVEW